MLRNGYSADSDTNQHAKLGSRSTNDNNEDTQTICSDTSSILNLDRPICKICHIGSSKHGDKLISPCKCSGTMQYIHCACLLKWLEMSNRANEKPMSCELCGHEYSWHKKFNYKQIQLPKCSFKDILYHTIFMLAVGGMIFSALAPMLGRDMWTTQTIGEQQSQSLPQLQPQHASSNFRLTDSNNRIVQKNPSQSYHGPSSYHHVANGRLGQEERFLLFCAASFFLSFFLAIYVQTKARETLLSLFINFMAANQTYYITEYNHGQSQTDPNRHVNTSTNTDRNMLHSRATNTHNATHDEQNNRSQTNNQSGRNETRSAPQQQPQQSPQQQQQSLLVQGNNNNNHNYSRFDRKGSIQKV